MLQVLQCGKRTWPRSNGAPQRTMVDFHSYVCGVNYDRGEVRPRTGGVLVVTVLQFNGRTTSSAQRATPAAVSATNHTKSAPYGRFSTSARCRHWPEMPRPQLRGEAAPGKPHLRSAATSRQLAPIGIIVPSSSSMPRLEP